VFWVIEPVGVAPAQPAPPLPAPRLPAHPARSGAEAAPPAA
jgi:hypothetical protein